MNNVRLKSISIKLGYFLMLFLLFRPVLSTPSSIGKRIQVEWRAPRDYVSNVKDNLKLENEKITPQKSKNSDSRAVPALYILVGATTISLLVDTILKIIKFKQHGGLIIDARGERLIIEENYSLGPECVVVIKKGQKQTKVSCGTNYAQGYTQLINAIKN